MTISNYERNIYSLALGKWGERTQADMLQGECGELVAELTRFYTQQKASVRDVVGEMVDVDILLNQMKTVLGEDLFEEIKREKLLRLAGILDGTIQHPHA